ERAERGGGHAAGKVSDPADDALRVGTHLPRDRGRVGAAPEHDRRPDRRGAPPAEAATESGGEAMNPLCGLQRRALARRAARGAPRPGGSRLAEHGARCARCRPFWNDLPPLPPELSQTWPAPTPSAAFTENVWARLATAAEPRMERRLEPQMNADERR